MRKIIVGILIAVLLVSGFVVYRTIKTSERIEYYSESEGGPAPTSESPKTQTPKAQPSENKKEDGNDKKEDEKNEENVPSDNTIKYKFNEEIKNHLNMQEFDNHFKKFLIENNLLIAGDTSHGGTTLLIAKDSGTLTYDFNYGYMTFDVILNDNQATLITCVVSQSGYEFEIAGYGISKEDSGSSNDEE